MLMATSRLSLAVRRVVRSSSRSASLTFSVPPPISTIGSSRSSNSVRSALLITACMSYSAVMYVR